jgi:GH24 family phage-related lysozyme (muramidase)
MLMSTAARLNMRSTEKKVLKYYDDGGKTGRGNCTWGVGILAHRGPCTKAELARSVTDVDIEREFASRLAIAERGVERNVKVELTQAQFDALVSFAYNAGVDGSSKVFERLNASDFEGAANAIAAKNFGHEFRKGKKVKVVYPGLVIRRAEEAAPFRNKANAISRSAAT